MAFGYGKKKESGSRLEYASWAGNAANPDVEPDLFALLPSWRQEEILETRRISKEHPNVVAIRLINPATHEPYPGQVTYRDIRQQNAAKTAKAATLPPIPAKFAFKIPNGIPLSLWYDRAKLFGARQLTPEQADNVLASLEQHVTTEKLIEACTTNGKLRRQKPADGVYAYVWRLARFDALLEEIPVTCFWDLEDGLEHLTGLRVSTDTVTPPLKSVLAFLKQKSDDMVDALGANKFAAKRLWAQVQGVIS